MKVSYPPFFFECWLYEKVDDDKCKTIVNSGLVTLELVKVEAKQWPQISHPDQGILYFKIPNFI